MNRKILILAVLLLITAGCTGDIQSCPPCPTCPPRNAVEPAKPQSKADLDITDMNHKRDSIGNLIIVGLIENVSSEIARQIEVRCSGFASDGSLVDLNTTYPDHLTLAPGQETSFICYLDEISPMADYKCVVSWD